MAVDRAGAEGLAACWWVQIAVHVGLEPAPLRLLPLSLKPVEHHLLLLLLILKVALATLHFLSAVVAVAQTVGQAGPKVVPVVCQGNRRTGQ